MSIGISAEFANIDSLRNIFRRVMTLTGRPEDRRTLGEIHVLCPTVDDWRRMFAVLPLDKSSFQLDLGTQRTKVIAKLSQWCRDFQSNHPNGLTNNQADVHGFLVVLLITLITMEPAAADHDCAGLCHSLVRDASVRSALRRLYAPLSPVDQQTTDEWARIESNSFEFHRHGSTSFIISGLAKQFSGRRFKFALKFVLLPYSSIPAIANKTRNYTADHNSTDVSGRPVEHMVHVWASTENWILMDFAEGDTLADEISRITADPTVPVVTWGGKRVAAQAGNVRLDLIRKLGLPLLSALGELHARGKLHEDLSPTNVIVRRRDEGYDVTFIDFGRNYLYIGAVGRIEGADGAFVAPEVRANADSVARADLYSLGRILIAIGDVGQNPDGTIPDRFYGQAPLIARLVEDLIDQDPNRRLLVFPIAPGGPDVYQSLRDVLEQELDVTQAELVDDTALRRHAIPYQGPAVREMLVSLLRPSREPKRRWRIFKLRKQQGVLSNPRRSMYARWLLTFSIIGSVVYVVTAIACVYWFFRDVGIGITNPSNEIAIRVMGGTPDAIPVIDALRRPTYHLGDVWANLPARIIGLSFSLAGARYYQNILSGLTTRVAQSRVLPGMPLRLEAEVAMRVMALWPSWLILAVNLVDTRWWPLGTAVGYTWVILSNFLTAQFAARSLDQARKRGLSTVPPKHQTVSGLENFQQWGPTVSLYSLAVWIIAVLLYTGILHDTYVYASATALVNVGLFYIIKTGMSAPDIRAGLNRCFLAAERLRYDSEQRAAQQQPSPAMVGRPS